MAACLATVMVATVMFRPASTRAQSAADDVLAIPVHPDVPTVVRLPDDITRTRVTGSSIRVTSVGRTMHVRPRAGAPVGLQALLEVETRTMILTFRLHVVEGYLDARADLVVVAMQSERRAEEGPVSPPDPGRAGRRHAAPGAEQTARMETSAGARGAGSTATLAPPPAEPAGERERASSRDRVVASDATRDVLEANSPKLDISVHAVGSPGITSLQVRGYEYGDARQPHLTFGMRVSGGPQGAWWAVAAGISTELPLAPTVHLQSSDAVIEVGGPRLRMDVDLRAHFGTRWRPTIHAGIGLQAHFRNVDGFWADREDRWRKTWAYSRQDMPFGGVLVFGMGFEHRRGDMLLGVEVQVRQGLPAEYHSVDWLLSVGYLLDQGE